MGATHLSHFTYLYPRAQSPNSYTASLSDPALIEYPAFDHVHALCGDGIIFRCLSFNWASSAGVTSQKMLVHIHKVRDFVVCFENEKEARIFGSALRQRMIKFGLTISEEKSKIIEFVRFT